MKISNKIKLLIENLPPEFSSEEAGALLRSAYKAPNKLLEELVDSGDLIRLKKGLFTPAAIFNALAAGGRIHGPSYLSFETALDFYGMLPERVNAVMSVVDGRQLEIESAGILFIYRSQSRSLFSKGMTATSIDGRNVLIATPEKALLDMVAWDGLNTKHSSQSEVYDYVCESYRLSDDDVIRLQPKQLKSLASMYRSRAPGLFVEELMRRRSKGK